MNMNTKVTNANVNNFTNKSSAVRDRGNGNPPEEFKEIMEKYIKGKETRSKEKEGIQASQNGFMEDKFRKDCVDNAINIIDNLLDTDIAENKDKYYKQNGKLNILDIIDRYGDSMGYSDLNEFAKAVNSLWENGEIDEKDYFIAIKWIAAKVKEKSIELEAENRKMYISEILE